MRDLKPITVKANVELVEKARKELKDRKMGIFRTQEELLRAVSLLPPTIEGLKVQRSLQSFSPPSTHLDMSMDLVEQTKEVIKKAFSDPMFSDTKVEYYRLHSYCGDYCPGS